MCVILVNYFSYFVFFEGNLFFLFENFKRRLILNMIYVLDFDIDFSSFSFLVFGNFNLGFGFLENISDFGRVINGFIYRDLRGGNIFYVYRGRQNFWIFLRVSDGELVSNIVMLRVMVDFWDFEVVNRIGVVVSQSGMVLIIQSNLLAEDNG